MNKANYRRVLDQIEQHPDTWDQSQWHCGSTHCFAGWAQLLSGKTSNEETTRRDARIYLDISIHEADYFFDARRTLEELKDGYTRAGLDLDGYDRAGLNLAGYDRAGYDRAGYNRAGYDWYGYNRAGLNLAGYDRDGYDRYGYDRYGYNRAGLDWAGYNRAGYDRDGLDEHNRPQEAPHD